MCKISGGYSKKLYCIVSKRRKGIHLELKQLEHFKAVAESNHLSKAAESLYITQPALSKSISKLEEEVGFPLFEHQKNKISVNAHGEKFLAYADKVLQAYQELKNYCDHVKGSIRKLRIIASDNLAYRYIEPMLQMKMPDLEATFEIVDEKNLYPMLLNGEADLVLTTKSTVNANVTSLPLFEEISECMVAPGHRLYDHTSIHLAEMEGETLLFPESDIKEGEWVQKRFLDYGVHIHMKAVDDMLFRTVAIQGVKYMIGTSSLAKKFWPPLPPCKSIPMEEMIEGFTHYTFYYVFAADNRSMGDLYLKLKPLLQ